MSGFIQFFVPIILSIEINFEEFNEFNLKNEIKKILTI